MTIRGTYRSIDYGSSSRTVASSASADTDGAAVGHRTDQSPYNKVTNNAAAAAAAATVPSTTTAPADTSTGTHSQTPKVNYQFSKDIVPGIFDGKQRNDFREWAENSALYLSTQCADACEILLECLVMEKEHVNESATLIKCDDEDWDYD